jgi:catechol 2,3-dioxygenase-like lactoylglutathione lyase family enzyme
MSRVQLALRVADLDRSVLFYSTLFGVEPAKRRPGYANFAIAEPPLKLVLLEGEPGEPGQPGRPTVMDHLGVEVESTEAVDGATQRLEDAGLATFSETDTDCCYAVQDKVWVHGPGQEPWEVYVVKADGTSLENQPAGCCTGEGCTNDCCSASTSEATNGSDQVTADA